MKYKITHTTVYQYADKVSLSQNQARLMPANLAQQTCLESELRISPVPSFQYSYLDSFNNLVTHFDITVQHQVLSVTSTHVVEIAQRPQLELVYIDMHWEAVHSSVHQPLNKAGLDIYYHSLPTTYTHSTPEIVAYTQASFSPGRDMLTACKCLMERIFTDFEFDSQATTVNATAPDIFALKKGVCQDFVHVALACLRSIGLACQYVSGYIETIPPEGAEKLVGADATHAWYAVFLPSHGWIEFDPTNNVLPNNQHIRLATGRDYLDVAPLKGLIYGGGEHQLDVSVDMNRIN